MDTSQRIPAVLTYIPIVGWLFALLTQSRNAFVMFHLRQAIGLILFLLAVLIGWAVVAWVLLWLPFAALLSISLFALVIAAAVFGIFVWIIGIINAGRGKATLLPVFGRRAARLPIGAL